MAQLYKRVANLTVTNATGLGRDFSNLRVQFKVEKTSESASNKGIIKIYNLSKDSRTFIESDELQVRLSAGYAGLVEQIFVGEIGPNAQGKTMSVRQPPDWITTIECGDGEVALT